MRISDWSSDVCSSDLFMETGPDPEFDQMALEWFRTGDIDAILANVTHESMAQSGNATHGFLNFILMMGVAGRQPADYVDNLDLFHTMEAYVTWYPKAFAEEQDRKSTRLNSSH